MDSEISRRLNELQMPTKATEPSDQKGFVRLMGNFLAGRGISKIVDLRPGVLEVELIPIKERKQ